MASELRDENSLDWTWNAWREWALELIDSHSKEQVADSIADMGQQMNDLRQGMGAEAQIICAQALSLNPKTLGKNRSRIVREQVRRMYDVAQAKQAPRSVASNHWRERIDRYRSEFERYYGGVE